MNHSTEQSTKDLPSDYVGNSGRGVLKVAVPSQLSPTNSLDEILSFARKDNASDVHLSVNRPIVFRQYGVLKKVTTETLSATQMKALLNALPPQIVKDFEASGDCEYIHTLTGCGRFRMTLIKQRNGFDLTARLIPMEIPTFEQTGMPEACMQLTKWAQGLILIAGPAGCGKTTSLSVLIEMINNQRHDHIITIEEPVEIVFESKKCRVTQREINVHTLSRNNALRAALREDPDILVVSELRDLSTIQLAISASETGHLVLGTMNTNNAIQTISSLIDSFPAEEQGVMRNMISESLRGVICQQLIPRKDGKGMVAAYEVLLVNGAVANLIREGKMNQIQNVITTGRAAGMVQMDTSLESLAKLGTITAKEACERATNSATMVQMINS